MPRTPLLASRGAKAQVQGSYSSLPPTSTQIQVGNFNQTIATLQLGGSETAIIVSIVICSVLLLLSVVGKDLSLMTPWRADLPTSCPSPSEDWQIGGKA